MSPWAAPAPSEFLLTLQPAPSFSQVVVSGEKAAGAQTPSLAFRRLTHAPSLTPHLSLPLHHCLSFSTPGEACWEQGGSPTAPRGAWQAREALAWEAGRAAVTSCGCLGVMVKGNTPAPPPPVPATASLRVGFGSSSSKATQAAASMQEGKVRWDVS